MRRLLGRGVYFNLTEKNLSESCRNQKPQFSGFKIEAMIAWKPELMLFWPLVLQMLVLGQMD